MAANKPASSNDAQSSDLGSRLRERRLELGLKGPDVARCVGISPKRYNNYEAGKRRPNAAMLHKISAALQATIDQLLSPEPVLLGRDEQTYHAVRRFEEACGDLTGQELEMLADVAEVAQRRRREEREHQAQLAERDPFAPKLGIARAALAKAYERVLPAIIRTHRPIRVQTEVQERADGRVHLFVIVHYAGRTEPKGAERALLQLAKERLLVRDSELRIVRTQMIQKELEVVLEIICGTQRT